MNELLAAANAIWKAYSEMLKTNPVIAGAITLYGMGIFTWAFRTVPGRIIAYIKGQFMVGVAIHNNDQLFTYVVDWLEKGEKVFRCKSFAATVIQASKENVVCISVGYGSHIFFHKRRMFWLSRVEKEANNTTDRKESLFINTYGWYPDSIRKFLQDVVPQPSKGEFTVIYNFYDSYWSASVSKKSRKLDSVILTEKNETAIKKHIQQYLVSKEWYDQKIIPWRTGIVLEGPPGTGKSTLALALCGEFNCNLFIANLSMVSDDKLVKMFRSLPPKSVILIEDIDSYAIAKTRKKQKAKKGGSEPISSSGDEKDDSEKLFGSLSGLLNAIDGLTATEDRILLATTNHIEKLDPALVRPGRFELILKIDNLNDETARKMFKKFYPDFKLPANFKMKENVSPATFQTMAIGNKENPNVLLEFCNDSNYVHKNKMLHEKEENETT